MKPEHKSVIDALRDEGYLVVIWTPEELIGVAIDHVENRVIELGNEVINNLEKDDDTPNGIHMAMQFSRPHDNPATQDGAPE